MNQNTVDMLYKEVIKTNLTPITYAVVKEENCSKCKFFFRDSIEVVAHINELRDNIKNDLNDEIKLDWDINDNTNLIEINISMN